MYNFFKRSPIGGAFRIGILMILLKATSTEGTQFFVRISSYDNVEISGSSQEGTPVFSSVQCAMVCFVTSCSSFRYNAAELRCRVLDIHFLNSTTSLAPLGQGWEYFTYVFAGQRKKYKGHSYMMIQQKSTWFNAKKYCSAIDYYLLEITSAEENSMVDGFAQNTDVWIGLYDNSSSITGFVWNHSLRPTDDYMNWRNGEPSKHPFEYCVIFDMYGEWIDIPCDKEKAFICEK